MIEGILQGTTIDVCRLTDVAGYRGDIITYAARSNLPGNRILEQRLSLDPYLLAASLRDPYFVIKMHERTEREAILSVLNEVQAERRRMGRLMVPV